LAFLKVCFQFRQSFSKIFQTWMISIFYVNLGK